MPRTRYSAGAETKGSASDEKARGAAADAGSGKVVVDMTGGDEASPTDSRTDSLGCSEQVGLCLYMSTGAWFSRAGHLSLQCPFTASLTPPHPSQLQSSQDSKNSSPKDVQSDDDQVRECTSGRLCRSLAPHPPASRRASRNMQRPEHTST